MLYTLGCIIGIGGSFLFHLLNCIDYDYHERLRQLDFFGISTTIIGSIWCVMYCCFYCHDFLWNIYVIVCVMITGFLLSLPFSDFISKNRVGRTLLYITGGLLPLVNMMHITMVEGLHNPLKDDVFFWIMSGYTCFFFGVSIYAFRLPERFSPGKYDYIGHSHNIWHVLVVLGQYSVLVGLMNGFDKVIHETHCHPFFSFAK